MKIPKIIRYPIIALLLTVAVSVHAQPIAIFWPLSSAADTPGGIGFGLHQNGWKKTIATQLVPMLKWAEEAGVEVQIIAHLPFGQYDGDMRLDAYDAAVASDLDAVTHEFPAAWKPITGKYHSIGYVGDIAFTQEPPAMPWKDVGQLIQRNLKPFKEAGFARVCIDHSEDAISTGTPAAPVVVPDVGNFYRSRNAVLLSAADAMFGQRAMVESTPRNFPQWAPLASRDIVIDEDNFRRRHGPPGELSGNALRKGYGDRSYLKGRVYRIVKSIEDARRVYREGDVPAIKAYLLMGKGKASEVVE